MTIDPYAGPPESTFTVDDEISFGEYLLKLDLRKGRVPDARLLLLLEEARTRKTTQTALR